MMLTLVNAREVSAARPSQPASPFEGILAECRRLVCERLDQALAGMLDKASEGLAALALQARGPAERRPYERVQVRLADERDFLERPFRTHYAAEFQRVTERARRTGAGFADLDDLDCSLELVGEDDLEETLRFNEMAARLLAYCQEELAALDQRVGVLLGDGDLGSADNPFGPQAICDAYKHACRQADEDPGARKVLLGLFDDYVLDEVRSIYKEVNALLIRNAILPRIRYGIARKEERAAPGAAAGSNEETPAASAVVTTAAGAAQDLFSVLQNLVVARSGGAGLPGSGAAASHGTGPAGAAAGHFIGGAGAGTGNTSAGAGGAAGLVIGAAGAVAGHAVAGLGAAAGHAGDGSGALAPLQGAELLSSLTRIQLEGLAGLAGGSAGVSPGAAGAINVLHELKATPVGAGMAQLDLLTLDIMAMLFDQMFDDPKVPNGVKGLIGRLQIPMLKVAIADKSFFSSKTHPARRLLDVLGDLALRLPADFSTANPLFARLQDTLQELIDGFREDLAIFTATRERLDAILAQEDRRIEQEARPAARQVEEKEGLALARSAAQQEIKARIRSRNLPRPVLEFLVRQWLKLLVLVHAKEGGESDSWREALATMDQLVWSVEPKTTVEERRELARLVPGLIKRLSTGLWTAGIEDDTRAQFFGELMRYHTQSISAPGQGRPGAEAGAQTAPAATGESDPATLPPELTAPVTIRNPFGEGEVRVEGDEGESSTAAGAARSRRYASISERLDSLAPGTWVEFLDDGSEAERRAVRLIFVSPRRTRYLFAVDRSGKNIVECTRAEFGRRLLVGEAAILEAPPEESLFDRIMSGVLGRLRAAPR